MSRHGTDEKGRELPWWDRLWRPPTAEQVEAFRQSKPSAVWSYWHVLCRYCEHEMTFYRVSMVYEHWEVCVNCGWCVLSPGHRPHPTVANRAVPVGGREAWMEGFKPQIDPPERIQRPDDGAGFVCYRTRRG